MTERILAIENPVSGLIFHHRKEREVEKILSQKYDVDVYRTKAKGDATRTAKQRGEYYDIVMASGGDGTINEVLAGLMQISEEKRPALICIPAGTSNLLAEALDIPQNMAEAAKTALESEALSMDVGMIDDIYFATTISFGCFTDVTYNTPQQLKNMFGYGAYVMGAVKSLNALEPYHMKITLDDKVIEDDFILGAVSNVVSIGGIIKLDKNIVEVDDGLFEVLLIKKPNNATEFGNLMASFAYRDYNSEFMKLYKTGNMRIEIDKPIPWTVDGEYIKDFATVDIKMFEKAIRVYRPKSIKQ